MRYGALGGGSYHWRADTADGRTFFLTVDDLRDKPWLGADAEPAFRGLRAAFGTALALRERARLPFVLAPLPTLGGAPDDQNQRIDIVAIEHRADVYRPREP